MAQFNLSITLEYSLIGSDDKDMLVEVVNEWLTEGWQPLGGPFVYEGDLCQAVVREKPKKEPALSELAEAIKRTNRIMSDES